VHKFLVGFLFFLFMCFVGFGFVFVFRFGGSGLLFFFFFWFFRCLVFCVRSLGLAFSTLFGYVFCFLLLRLFVLFSLNR